MKCGNISTAMSLWKQTLSPQMNLRGVIEDENDDQKREWEIVTRQPVFISTDPPPVDLGE